jgi:inorganic pyrophosphatase/exopolyphosphatase
MTASAITLVCERFIKEFPEVLDSEMALFFAAPIVLDSYYFDESFIGSRNLEKDREVHAYLNKLADVGKSYWEKLNQSKFDINLNMKLGLHNLLKKDFKTYYLLDNHTKGLGVSSIVVPLDLIFSEFGEEALAKELDFKLTQDNLGLMSIVTNHADEQGGYHKELMIYSNNEIYSSDKAKFMELAQALDIHEGYQLKNKKEYQIG